MKTLKRETSLSIANRIERKPFWENVMQAAVVGLMLAAIFSAYFSVFDARTSAFQIITASVFSALFLLLIMRNRKHQIKAWLMGLTLLTIAAVILWKSLYGGFVSYINRFIELYNEYYVNYKPVIVAESTEYSSVITLFYLGVVLGFILYVILDKKKGVLFTILITSIPVILSAVVGKMPLPVNWWMMIVAVCFYLLVYRQNQGTLSVKGFLMLVGTLAGIIVLSSVFQLVVIDYKNLHIEEYNQIRKELLDSQEKNLGEWKDAISDVMNPTDYFEGGISKGKLSKNASVNPTGEVAMEIIMTEKPSETLYLKAYVGSEYTGDSWDEISARELSEILPSVGGNEKRRELMNEPFRRVSEGDYVTSSNPPRVEEITIELVNASREFGYTPYFAEITSKHKVHKDLYIEGDLSKTRKYTFYPFSVYSGIDYSLSSYYPYPSYGEVGFFGFFGVELAEPSDLGVAYEEFVKKAYVDNHEELELLREYCNGISKRNIEGELLYLFDSGFYYSRNPGEMPKDMDFAEGFLFNRNVGYCVHYATAATLVYQMCGYPARYVEGYAVSPSSFARYEDGTYHATVTDGSAHAWCEVYDTEVGWVAKEFTPDTGQFTNAVVNSKEEWQEDDSKVDESLNEEPIEVNPQNPEEDYINPQAPEGNVDNSGIVNLEGGLLPGGLESNKNGGSDTDIWISVKEIIWKCFWISMLILFVIIALMIQQKLRRAKRLKGFKRKKGNKGILSIYNAIYELCVFAGFRTEQAKEKEQLQEIVVRFPQLTETEWHQVYTWAEKAAFSNEKLSSEVQKEMYCIYRKFRNEILKTLSFKKKILFIYIKAL